jgi:hypothetical protein
VYNGALGHQPRGAPDILGEASANILYEPWLVSSDLNGDCNSGTARAFKSIALSQLQAMGSTGNKDTDKRIADAIVRMASILARPNWVDDDRIDGKTAGRIFNDEKSAATSLQGIKGTKPAGVMAALESLVTADRIIAQTAIDDAAGGNAGALAEAAKAMVKAQEALAKGRYDTAIEQYKIAWKHAKRA